MVNLTVLCYVGIIIERRWMQSMLLHEVVMVRQIQATVTEYDAIGFASGIYYGKFHQAVLNFATVNLPQEKKVFLICTHGGSAAFQSIETILEGKHADLIGKYSCKGYDTYGLFKLVGGIAKGHPDEKDLMAAVDFYKGITT